MPYIGTSPSNGVRRVHTYTATASQTTFTGASSEGVTLSYADTNYLDVFQNGVLLGSADYTSTSGTSVVLAQGASVDDLIVIIVYDVFSVADTVSKANGGSFDSAVTMSGGISGNTSISGDLTIPDKIIHDGDTNTAIRFPSADTISFETSGSEAMRIDSSGNVGIGTTSMTTGLEIHGSDDNACTIKLRDLSDYSSGTGPTIAFQGKDSSESIKNFSQIKGVSNSSNNGMLIFETRNSGSIAERMRIKNDGNVMINTTSTSPSPGVSLQPSGAIGLGNAGGTSGTSFMEFRRNGTQIGSITQSGTTGVNFNNSSDYRLKENVSYDFDGTSRLKQLKPARFNFIGDTATVDGFLAHEVSDIVPHAISGKKDAMTKEVLYVDGDEIPKGKKVGDVKYESQIAPQGIDHSKLVPLLVKTIQELEARITALENAE
jgi:hypothetical protein